MRTKLFLVWLLCLLGTISTYAQFITTWQTTEPNESITIPTTSIGYNYSVDWGDGTITDNHDGNATHSYTTAGIYTVSITGDFPRIYFNNRGDKDKILTIEQWGDNPWGSMESAFYGCSNLQGNFTDRPDLSNVTSLARVFSRASTFNAPINDWDTSNVTIMQEMFARATSFNQPLGNWDVSNVTNMRFMFIEASSFNQDISNWNVSNVRGMDNMLEDTVMSIENYEALLTAWSDLSLQNDTQFTISTYYCNEAALIAKNKIIDTYNWIINDEGNYCGSTIPFITTWQTTEANESITIPTVGAGYNYIVDWGDGTVTNNHRGNATHDYSTPGVYTVSVTGIFPRVYFNDQGDKEKILTIEQWGDNPWVSMLRAFFGCSNLQGNFTDSPDLSNVNSMFGMFSGASSFNYPVEDWDVSNVTNMVFLFSEASSFNQPIGNWDVSNVTNMNSIFSGATSFNQPIRDWDVSSVINMTSMFSNARSFDQPIGDWDVSNVLNMNDMFSGARSFDQPIGDWDVSNVTNMRNMFYDASSFNQPVGNWDVSQVAVMWRMFYGARSFDQNVSNWDVSNVFQMYQVFLRTKMSSENYDALLIAWSELELQNDLRFDMEAPYCSEEAITARQKIINDFNWTINDDGRSEFCVAPPFITTWLTTEGNERITIPTTGDGYNYTVDWGDGTITYNHRGDAIHIYNNAGLYRVKVAGDFPRIYFNNQGKMTDDNKDKIQTIEQWGTNPWTSMEFAFFGCSNLQGDFSDSPNLENVTSLRSMFSGASSFNQSINDWDTSNITDTSNMFNGATSYNQPLDRWDVSNVTLMDGMFSGTSDFNQSLNNWNTSSVESMEAMFSGATSFNQPINEWDVSRVANMSLMFYEATGFNQPLNDWHTSNVTAMRNMFFGASSFDQSLDDWDISNLTSMEGMLDAAAMSTENYDALLISWSELTLQNDIIFDVNASYCSDEATVAREKIVNDYNWTINDLGKDCQVLNIDDLADSEMILIYPNPAITYVHIDTKNLQSEDTIAIIDISGKTLHTVQTRQGTAGTTIDTSDLASGLYWIQVMAKQRQSTYKLVIQ